MWQLVLQILMLFALEVGPQPLDSQGHRWTFYLATPSGQVRPPVVVLLHGQGASAGSFLERSGWADKARAEGFLVVCPSARLSREDQPSDFLSNPRVWRGDEGPMVLDLLQRVQEQWQGDPTRTYLVGHDSGAYLAYRLAASYPHRWAALAALQGPVFPPLQRLQRAVPTYALFGQEDPLLPLSGGLSLSPWGARNNRPVAEMLDRWSQALAVQQSWEPLLEDDSQLTQQRGPNLQVSYLKGHGHGYPSPTMLQLDPSFGPIRADLNVNDWIWDWLKAKSL